MREIDLDGLEPDEKRTAYVREHLPNAVLGARDIGVRVARS